MPIAYLDVPTGINSDRKRDLMKALYEALNEAYPVPDDHRVFLREWSANDVSQNGILPAEPFRPVFVIHGPQGATVDAKRSMLKKINAAVADAYKLPDFMIFMHEYSLDLVAHEGGLLADDSHRVEDQKSAYS
jgi:hypothetical protein